jgi:YVTN family beta-propeller protein
MPAPLRRFLSLAVLAPFAAATILIGIATPASADDPQPVLIQFGNLSPQYLAISSDDKSVYFTTATNTIGDFHVDTGKATIADLSSPGFHIATGSGDPQTIWVTKNTKIAVSPVDATSLATKANLYGGNTPYDVIVAYPGYVFESSAGDDHVQVLNESSRTAVASIPVGSYPTGLAASRDGLLLYVTNTHGDSVTIIDVPSLSVVGTIPVGRSPVAIAIDPGAGDAAFVVNQGDDSISVVDLRQNAVIGTINGLDLPTGVAVGRDGLLYVSSYGRTDHGSLDVVDWVQKTVVRQIDVGQNPSDVVASSDGTTIYIAVPGSHGLAILDVSDSAALGSSSAGGTAAGTTGGGAASGGTSTVEPTPVAVEPAPGASPLTGVDPLILVVAGLGVVVVIILIVLIIVLIRRKP